ncbi:ribbon-helix-helix protein, CopG family [Egbenema bharatensis]|uniref:ribbon-helix-helix protein, CopG family n=1 Tax=Egbenema bharatensis TaxID=3463334 RepID=UPI003A898432
MSRQKADREEYGEKKDRVNISLTPTAQRLLDQQGAAMGISRSELIERLARGLISSNPEVRSLGGFCAN